MFRSSSLYNRFIALLMPAIFLWSWMACVSVCAEITENTSETSAVSQLNACGESISQSSGLDGCQFTATPATLQDRQTVVAPVLANIEISFPPVHRPAFAPSVIKSDINQNSPPEITVLLFLRLQNFRI